MELYHYLHCPYCIRVRIAWGYLGINYKSIVLPYRDEETPVKLTGKKMLPIAKMEDGSLRNESLEIIASTDKANKLQCQGFVGSARQKVIEEVIESISAPLFNLAMPFYALSGEFTPEDRKYFVEKKSIKRGPFNLLLKNREKFQAELVVLLENFENQFTPFFESKSLKMEDVILASHLWGLYLVPEFRFSEKLHQYLQMVKRESNFSAWKDYGQFLIS
ncbi:MAG: glutathione S-transferase N-terminal domain-containing protein [Bacteriovoracaceae bacterium]|nr:glutathione S-transferase N-terminal domain-containing protein [Bacteriovoracaceae bacterium]